MLLHPYEGTPLTTNLLLMSKFKTASIFAAASSTPSPMYVNP